MVIRRKPGVVAVVQTFSIWLLGFFVSCMYYSVPVAVSKVQGLKNPPGAQHRPPMIMGAPTHVFP